MNHPPGQQVFLHPGEFHFGAAPTMINTLLGSCVSITLWHPQRRIGGMCHFLLPTRGKTLTARQDGAYADEAFSLFISAVAKHRTPLAEYEAKLFGGGNMFAASGPNKVSEISRRNVEAAIELLTQNGLPPKTKHVGGAGHRRIAFDLNSGHVWLRQFAPQHMARIHGGLHDKFAHSGS